MRREVPGHLTDRLQEALWREILHMVNDGVATTRELDESIIYGPGLRWAAMGTNQIYHLAGGEPGMRHMLHQFGPCLKWPWTKLEAPELTEELIDRMVEGTAEQAAGRSIRELERLRDNYLVAVQQSLKPFNIGAGATLNALEARLYNEAAARAAERIEDPSQPLRLFETDVRPEWVDYNGHMTDYRYQHVFGEGVDALLRRVGIDEAYRAAGMAPYTVEMTVRYHAEVKQSDRVYMTTQVLDVDAKRFWLFHRMHRVADDRLVATGEHMFVHVDAKAAKACPMPAEVHARLAAIRDAHASLPRPAEAGRGISMRKD